MKVCAVCGVDSGHLVISEKFNMVLCRKHYMKGMNYGDPFKRTRKDPNDFITHDDYAEVILRDNNCNEIAKTKISIESVELVKRHKWYKNNTGYVVSFTADKKAILLHRLLTEVSNYDTQVDHINGDRLDNRLENLRICTQQQNRQNNSKQSNNKSGVAGVYFNKSNKGWVAQINYNRKYIYLGTFPTIEEATKARKDAEKKYRKEFNRKEGN